MSSLRFTIHHPSGQIENLVVDSPRALVGSAPHCEIRLPTEHAAPESLSVETREGNIWVEALSNQPIPLVAGRPLRAGVLRTSAAIALGSLELRINIDSETGSVTGESETKWRVYILAAAFVAAAAYAVTAKHPGNDALELPDAAPPLWPARTAACLEKNPAVAFARANELRVAANGERERSPFVPREGVVAVPTFRDAAACFEAAGKTALARAMDHDADRLASAMLEDYKLARLRLERALVGGDFEAARVQIGLLSSMLDGQSGDYVGFLATLERRIILRISETEKHST